VTYSIHPAQKNVLCINVVPLPGARKDIYSETQINLKSMHVCAPGAIKEKSDCKSNGGTVVSLDPPMICLFLFT